MAKSRDEIARTLKQAGVEFYEFEAAQIAAMPEGEREAAVKKRVSGYPLQYILGEWEFYGLPFFVGKGVFIPRPETELLAEKAIGFVKTNPGARVIELCAGSGCVCITVSVLAGTHVTAVENSPEAFDYLTKNIRRHRANVTPVFTDALTGVRGKYELILANPPYIRSDDLKSLSREVMHEPAYALDGGTDGLRYYRAMAENLRNNLSPGGEMLFEIGYDEKESVAGILGTAGFEQIECFRDLSGNDRIIKAIKRDA